MVNNGDLLRTVLELRSEGGGHMGGIGGGMENNVARTLSVLEDHREYGSAAPRGMSPGHYLCQNTTENVAALLGGHRGAMRVLKKELKSQNTSRRTRST